MFYALLELSLQWFTNLSKRLQKCSPPPLPLFSAYFYFLKLILCLFIHRIWRRVAPLCNRCPRQGHYKPCFFFLSFFLVISCDASRIWETTLSSVDPHWGWGVVIPNARLCLRHIANTAVSQRKCCYAVIELSHCDAGSKRLRCLCQLCRCVGWNVALGGYLLGVPGRYTSHRAFQGEKVTRFAWFSTS